MERQKPSGCEATVPNTVPPKTWWSCDLLKPLTQFRKQNLKEYTQID